MVYNTGREPYELRERRIRDSNSFGEETCKDRSVTKMKFSNDSALNCYCSVCEYVHEIEQDYKICDYCPEYKLWTSLPK